MEKKKTEIIPKIPKRLIMKIMENQERIAKKIMGEYNLKESDVFSSLFGTSWLINEVDRRIHGDRYVIRREREYFKLYNLN